MSVSDATALKFYSALAVVGTAIVVVGVVLEVAELIVKFRGEMEWRKRFVEIFGRERRRSLVLCARRLKQGRTKGIKLTVTIRKSNVANGQ